MTLRLHRRHHQAQAFKQAPQFPLVLVHGTAVRAATRTGSSHSRENGGSNLYYC